MERRLLSRAALFIRETCVRIYTADIIFENVSPPPARFTCAPMTHRARTMSIITRAVITAAHSAGSDSRRFTVYQHADMIGKLTSRQRRE